MKLSQMMKIYCRFRYFDINFGEQLSTYFEFSAKKFDPPTSRPQSEIVAHANKYYGNLVRSKVAIDVFEVNLVRVVIYGVSWLLKIVACCMLLRLKKTGKAEKALVHIINISQKVHMIALNAVALDLIVYALITIFHTRGLPNYYSWSSGILLSLLVMDFSEIWFKGGKSEIKEFRGDDQNQSGFTSYKKMIKEDLSEKNDETKWLEIDHKSTIRRLEQNMTITKFCTSVLVEKKQFSKMQFLLMANFSFLLKMSAMSLLFVSTATIPIVGLASLVLLEFLYLVALLISHYRYRHLRSMIVLLTRVSQSALLLTLEIILLKSYSQLQNQTFSLNKSDQTKLGSLVFASNIVEYIFLAFNIFMIVKLGIQDRKRKKTDGQYLRHVQESESLFVYQTQEEIFPSKTTVHSHCQSFDSGFNKVSAYGSNLDSDLFSAQK